MEFFEYIILEKEVITPDTFLLRIKPKDTSFITPFSPGQYMHFKNPAFAEPEQIHTFSITSSPNTATYLEFCIRTYGDWTKKLLEGQIGDILQLSGPDGNFTWDVTHDSNAVFLAGGIGIAPIISMLRFINEGKYQGNYVLLYGNRAPETIAYKNELEQLEKSINTCKVVHIFSDLSEGHSWKGYKGFISKEIVEKEVNISLKPTFFLIGPPIFIKKMKDLLHELSIEDKKIKTEILG